MKKFLILCVCLIALSGCQKVNDMTIDEIMQTFSSDIKTADVYRVGYKYNLPSRMQVDDSGEFIEVISCEDYIYYLYVDVVSYYNEVDNVYEINSDVYYSKKYEINGIISYLEINLIENDKYLIEIMYNYAKIEVMVDYSDINVALINCVNILNNIVFNEEIIENYLGDDVFNFTEEVYDIFDTASTSGSTYTN